MTPDPSSPSVALPAPAGMIAPAARAKPDMRRINRLHARLVERVPTLPPISWLPVLRDDDGDFVTMADAGWVHLAAVKFLAAFVGVDARTIRRHLKEANRLSN
jgi:hypothetical protein